MRKLLLVSLLVLIPASLFAQDDWRDRRADPGRSGYGVTDLGRDSFELTPFGGYRYGGTIYNEQTNLFNTNVDVASSPNFGVSLGMPLANTGLKLELMADRQDTNFQTSNGSLFGGNNDLGDFHITYYHAGLQIPFQPYRRSSDITPYAIVSAGVATLEADVPGARTSSRFSASAGVGVKVPISRNLGLRIEERGFYTNTSGNNNDSNCLHCYYDQYNHDLFQGETNIGFVISF